MKQITHKQYSSLLDDFMIGLQDSSILTLSDMGFINPKKAVDILMEASETEVIP